MRSAKKRLSLVSGALALCLVLGACGGSSDDEALTLYNAQHDELMQALVDRFTEETGIEVEMRSGSDFELANQIVQEGDATPADLFATENSPAMSLVANAQRFVPVDQATLDGVPQQYRPSDGSWTGFAARATVFVHNTAQLPESELPTSIMDLANPKWQGKIGIAPAGADFQAIVSAVLDQRGEQATRDWLAGLKANARAYQGNGAVMRAVNSGEIQGGVIYHYYWYKDQAEAGENSSNTELHFFGNQDPGAFTSVSGVGVLGASDQQEEAQRFVQFLTSQSGQQVLADNSALEYPIVDGVAANQALRPLAELQSPNIDPATLNGQKVTDLMREAGLL